jgi:hypothetical protein
MRKKISHRIINLFAPVLLMIGAAGCQSTNVSPNFPPISFAAKEVYMVDVAAIEVVEQYKSPFKEPNVEHIFPVPPASAVKTWSVERLAAKGSDKLLKVVIEDASVVRVPLKTNEGVEGFFTADQTERYDAKLKVALRIYNNQQATAESEVNVAVNRSRSVKEGISLAEKELFYHNLTKDLLNDFDREIDNQLPKYFGSHLIYR